MERGVLVQRSGRGRRARSSPLTFRRFGRAINTDEVFGTHRDQVLDVFRDANEPLTPKSVTEQLETRPGVSQSQSHFSHSAVRKILSRMAENGDLVRLKLVNTPSHRVSVTQSQFQERMIQTVEV
jgi:hypothetical protein